MRFVPVLLFCALLLAACSDTFDPFVDSDRAFALYGFLDARRDTQFVRVQPFTERAEPGSTVEARVTSTDLGSEESIVWQDSLVRLDDGERGTAFFAVFRPGAGRTYRIEATRPDGSGTPSAAVVMIPAEPPLQPAEPELVGELLVQRLTVASGVPPEDLSVTYTVQRVAGGGPQSFSFTQSAQPDGDGSFTATVALSRNARSIQSALGLDPDDPEREPVALLGLEVSYEIVDEERVEVTGGVGNVGAAAAFETGWTLAEEFVEAIGFVDAQAGGDGSPAAP